MPRTAYPYTLPLILAVACGGDGSPPRDSPQDDAGDRSARDAGVRERDAAPDPKPDASDDSDASTEECPQGFEASAGECVAAPCNLLDCGAYGSCAEVEGAAACECMAGFAGELCDSCAEGYEGDACDACTEGFVASEGSCVADVCIDVSCGDHGACIDDEGSAACACDEGWAGADCDTCAQGWASKAGQCVLEPSTLVNVRIWQDAAASSSLRFDAEGRVTEWRSRVPGEEELAFEAGAAESSRPGTVAEAGGRRRIVFDGDDSLTRTLTLNNNAYTMYVVVRWDADEVTQNLLGGTNADASAQGFALYATKAEGVIYRHRFPFGLFGGDAVASSDYAPAEGLQLIVAQRSNAGDGYLRQYFSADYAETAPLTSSAISDPLRLVLGANGITEVGRLQGEIAEILVYGGAHGQGTRDQISTYLRVKWGLPVSGQEL